MKGAKLTLQGKPALLPGSTLVLKRIEPCVLSTRSKTKGTIALSSRPVGAPAEGQEDRQSWLCAGAPEDDLEFLHLHHPHALSGRLPRRLLPFSRNSTRSRTTTHGTFMRHSRERRKFGFHPARQSCVIAVCQSGDSSRAAAVASGIEAQAAGAHCGEARRNCCRSPAASLARATSALARGIPDSGTAQSSRANIASFSLRTGRCAGRRRPTQKIAGRLCTGVSSVSTKNTYN